MSSAGLCSAKEPTPIIGCDRMFFKLFNSMRQKTQAPWELTVNFETCVSSSGDADNAPPGGIRPPLNSLVMKCCLYCLMPFNTPL